MAQGLICSEVYIIFPGQGLNPGTLLWQVNSYPLAPPGTSYSSHSDRCIAISYCGLSCISLITNNEHPLSVCLYHILRIYVYEFWIFVGMTDAEAEAPIFWPSDAENWLIGKDPVAGKDWRQEEKGYDTFSSLRGWDGWMALLTQWTWVWASPRSWWWTGKPSVLHSMGSQELDTTKWMNLLVKKSNKSSIVLTFWTLYNIPSRNKPNLVNKFSSFPFFFPSPLS